MNQTQSMHMKQEQRQILRMEQANLLEMPDDEFNRLISGIEEAPLFRRLYRQEKVVCYQRFPRTDISSSFHRPLNEDMIVDRGSIDIESLLLDKEHVISQIQKMGLEKFKRYFLFPESGIGLDEVARECDLEVSQVQEINNLVNEFSIRSEFYHPSSIASGVIRYSKIASVDKDKEGFVIAYFSPAFARGRYLVNYEKFEELRSAGALTEAEAKEAKQLFKKLELINSRKDTLNQILQNIVDKQALYLESQDLKTLLPFSQKELAEKIGVAASSVSRAIRGKSVDTPWGEEVPLKNFFPRPKTLRKGLFKQLLKSDSEFSSDEAIRIKLWEKFGVAISRRSVTNLRRELGFPATGRKRHSGPSKETE